MLSFISFKQTEHFEKAINDHKYFVFKPREKSTLEIILTRLINVAVITTIFTYFEFGSISYDDFSKIIFVRCDR